MQNHDWRKGEKALVLGMIIGIKKVPLALGMTIGFERVAWLGQQKMWHGLEHFLKGS